MRTLEVFGFKHYLSGPSDHPVDAPDSTSESMLSSGISRNIFIWVLIRDAQCTPGQDQAYRYSPVRTGTYQYMTVHDSTRILQSYETRTVPWRTVTYRASHGEGYVPWRHVDFWPNFEPAWEGDKRDKLKLVQLLCIRYYMMKSIFKTSQV